MIGDYIHATRVFVYALVKQRFSVRESLWWARRSMIGPDDWPVE